MACASLDDLNCPGFDQLPKDRGCQVRCGSEKPVNGKLCMRARKICAKLPGCVRVNLNQDASWATLKGLRGSPLAWCAPAVRPQTGSAACKRGDAMCVVFALSITAPDRYTQRPASSMPPGVPVLEARLLDYPKRRHVAITHLQYVVDAYDNLPGALALLVDHGDKHARSGADVCAQAVHVGDVARAAASGLLRGRAFKSLAPQSGQPLIGGRGRGSGTRRRRDKSNAAASSNASNASSASVASASGIGAVAATADADVRGFRCARHALTPAENAAWRALLTPHLGGPPRVLSSYSGHAIHLGPNSEATCLTSKRREVACLMTAAAAAAIAGRQRLLARALAADR